MPSHFLSGHCVSLAYMFLCPSARSLQGAKESGLDVGGNRLSCTLHPPPHGVFGLGQDWFMYFLPLAS